MRYKASVIAEHPDRTVLSLPENDEACGELLQTLVDYLPKVSFLCRTTVLSIRLTRARFRSAIPPSSKRYRTAVSSTEYSASASRTARYCAGWKLCTLWRSERFESAARTQWTRADLRARPDSYKTTS